jgi:hypothetical protein
MVKGLSPNVDGRADRSLSTCQVNSVPPFAERRQSNSEFFHCILPIDTTETVCYEVT